MNFKKHNFVKKKCPIRRLGSGTMHHFFGYYNKSVWDSSDRYVLANRTSMMDADIAPKTSIEVGYFDTQNRDTFNKVGVTTAWNWQMGCQLQWLYGQEGKKLIYNVRNAKPEGLFPSFGAIVYDVETSESHELNLPIYSVSPNSQFAITIDYSRLYITHKTIGYTEECYKKNDLPLCPNDDGVYRVDLSTGQATLLVSYAGLQKFHHRASMDNAIHWVSHIEINPSSSRILFLHRWTERVEDETCFLHRLITIDPDGRNMRLIECSDHPLPQLQHSFDPDSVGTYDYERSEYQISHPLWKDDSHIIVWGPHAGSIHYHLYQDSECAGAVIVGEDVLTENGHMSYSPTNQRWLLTDTYPDSETNIRKLLIYDTYNDVAYDIGDFYTSNLKKENRCDLHPRWSHDGNFVCIDSVHENERQMYIVDVSSVVRIN